MIDFDSFVTTFNNIYHKRFEKLKYKQLTDMFHTFYKMYIKLPKQSPMQVNMDMFNNQIIPTLLQWGFPLVHVGNETMARTFITNALPKNVPIKNKQFKNGFIDRYKIIEEIGSGAYGTVFNVKYKNKNYAIKQLYFENTIQAWDARENITNEIKLLRKASKIKPKITAKFHEAFISSDLHNLFIVMDYVNCGTLEEWTRTNKLTPDNIAQLEKLVRILHEHKIFHADLHLENILVECYKNGSPTFLISDFGLSKTIRKLKESNYDWIRNLGNNNNAITHRIQDYSPESMIKILIVYDIISHNQIKLVS